MHAIMKFRMRRRDRYECDVPHAESLRCSHKSDTNWPVKSQKKAGHLKFRILVERFYYLGSKNEGSSYCGFVFTYAENYLLLFFFPEAAHMYTS